MERNVRRRLAVVRSCHGIGLVDGLSGRCRGSCSVGLGLEGVELLVDSDRFIGIGVSLNNP